MVSSSIFVAVGMTRAPRAETLSYGFSIMKQLLYAFLIGFAISTGVSLFVLPSTSRGHLKHELKRYPGAVRSLLDAQTAYVKSSQTEGPWKLTRLGTFSYRNTVSSVMSRQRTGDNDQKKPSTKTLEQKAQDLKSAMNDLNSIHSHLDTNLYYAKQEIAWGKFTSEDLEAIFSSLRGILVALSGIGLLPEIFRKLSKPIPVGVTSFDGNHVANVEPEQGNDASESFRTVSEEYVGEHFIQSLSQRLEIATDLANTGIQHALVTLELVPAKHFSKNKKKKDAPKDEEASGEVKLPGSPRFAEEFERKLSEFHAGRKELPQKWAYLNAFTPTDEQDRPREHITEDREIRKEFFVILFIGHLQDVILQAIFDFVKLADSKVEDGTMKKKRFIFPKKDSLEAWLSFSQPTEEEMEKPKLEEDEKPSTTLTGRRNLLKSRLPDPEHLPPSNRFQKLGNILRLFSRFLGSDESAFGFRVAIASFSVAIMAFLRQTQEFYFKQRITWAVIVLVIGMSPTSGTQLFGLMGRIVGTTLSTGLTFAVWYIVAERTAGVIVLTYVGNILQVCQMPLFLAAG